MRTTLGRAAALVAFGWCLVAASGGVDAGAPSPSEPTTTTTPPPVVSEAPIAAAAPEPTTTTTAAPMVIDQPSVTPRRGTQAQVTDTQPPPPTTTTLPPGALPANSGEGRRIVYSKSQMRVWVVEGDETVVKTHLVSGRRTWNQPSPGTYSVFSRSSFTCNIKNPSICWRWMVRFTKGPDGDNIGFHEIPKNNGVPVQSESQLGQALSGGCVRQATPDALFVWNWAGIGTKVVVLG